MKMDLESADKDQVVNLLLSSNAFATNPNQFETQAVNPSNVNDSLHKTGINITTTKRGKKKYNNIKSHYNMESLNNDPNYSSRARFLVSGDKNNPEFTNDFNTATQKLISNLDTEENKANDNKEKKNLLKLLLKDNKNKVDVQKITKREYIDSKVTNYLNKKQQKIENINNKINDEFLNKHTFAPEFVTEKPQERRNLEQFLNDQNIHNKKIQDKITLAKENNEKQVLTKIAEMKPKIDEKSQKIYDSKFKTEEPAHLRLYNQRYLTEKNEALKKKPKSEKKNIKKKTNLSSYNSEPAVKKEKKSINKEENEKHIYALYDEVFGRKEKLENLKQKIINEEIQGKEFNTAGFYSNKVLLKVLMNKYKDSVNSVFAAQTSEDENNNIEYSKANLIQLNEILRRLGFVYVNVSSNTSNGEENGVNKDGEIIRREEAKYNMQINNNENQGAPESTLKQTEKKKVFEVWDNLKDKDGFVNIDKLFLFVLAVLNLYEYYLYTSYKKTFKGELETVKNEENKGAKVKKGEKTAKNLERKKEILNKISEEVENKVTKSVKYGGYDEEDNYILTYEKAKLINRDFHIFYVNFMENKILSINKNSKSDKAEPRFKPEINEKSNKLYSEFRKKVLNSGVKIFNNFINLGFE
jgi:hypothetical protein